MKNLLSRLQDRTESDRIWDGASWGRPTVQGNVTKNGENDDWKP